MNEHEFASLHVPGKPLVLPNVWDVAGARALVAAGFRAVGTTSLGVAASHGLPDGEDATLDETLRLVSRLATLPVLVTADIERGSVAAAVAAAEAGAVGVNVEDAFGDAAVHASLIRDIKRAVPGLFVNARTDTHWLRAGDIGEAVRRMRMYRDAGADGVFVPGVREPGDIARLVAAADVPLNVLAQPGGLTVAELGGLGVARISLGSLLFRAALAAVVETAVAVRLDHDVRADLPTYQEVNG
ncbi:isocitrate lyase/phosphoenolpyruvate mutase family protein [Dactylosporangium vinaceum]|uniref:Isocitrate lyase/phosphoenolpyruvate mutase family protein n=1 Tax=Dactylosporangium vinaceum TaxID=53362 RepID=A0ABV5MNS2_9ACTN|nr:isocitrate lyase/phosphoenolpyruvate mutase family protein [Dactylosporangium vinaceum]UAB98603.1 isocitrate lyase/phosphoenolpyruvate mutase family protein [Dactylosporangium vinaceum]